MIGLSLILQCILAGVLVLLALLSAQLAALGFVRHFRAQPRLRTPTLPDEVLPEVLVQLPVREEGVLAVRVATAAARLDWPRDKLRIQVLDDTVMRSLVGSATGRAVRLRIELTPQGDTIAGRVRGTPVGA